MKKNYIIASLVAIAAVVTGFFYFDIYEDTQSKDIRIMSDETDSLMVKPAYEPLLSFIDLESRIWTGIHLGIGFINEFTVNREIHLELENISPAGTLNNNKVTRDSEVSGFRSKLKEAISRIQNDTFGRDNSTIYIPVTRELNDLADSDYPNRVLILYSDLLENSTLLNVYDTNITDVSLQDSVITAWRELGSLKDLTGIKVWIIYQPTDTVNDQRFMAMYRIYRTLLEERGASVYVGASLPGA